MENLTVYYVGYPKESVMSRSDMRGSSVQDRRFYTMKILEVFLIVLKMSWDLCKPCYSTDCTRHSWAVWCTWCSAAVRISRSGRQLLWHSWHISRSSERTLTLRCYFAFSPEWCRSSWQSSILVRLNWHKPLVVN